MPHRRIQMKLIIDTTAHAQTIKTAVKTKLNELNIDIFKRDTDSGFFRDPGDGTPYAWVDIRWKNVPKANEFRDWIKDQALNSNARTWIMSGSFIHIHTCTHGDPVVVPCVVDEIWSKP